MQTSFYISFYKLYTNQMKHCTNMCGKLDVIVWVLLALLAVATNVYLRILLWKESRNAKDYNRGNHRFGSVEFTVTAFMVIFIFATGFSALLAPKLGDPFVVRLIFVSNMCVSMPLIIFLTKPKMTKKALMKLRQKLSNQYNRNASIVSPL